MPTKKDAKTGSSGKTPAKSGPAAKGKPAKDAKKKRGGGGPAPTLPPKGA